MLHDIISDDCYQKNMKIKLIALTDLLSDIAGRDILSGSMYHNRDAETRSAGTAEIFSRLRGQLEKCESRHEGKRRIWTPFWLNVRREDHAELVRMYTDATEEEIQDFMEVHFPDDEEWLRVEFAADDEGRLEIHIAPLWFNVLVDHKNETVVVSGGLANDIEERLIIFSSWLLEVISSEIRAVSSDPILYKTSLNQRIPLTQRFAKIQRKQLWATLSDAEHFIVSEMTPTEIEEFQKIARMLSHDAVCQESPLSGFSVADYFRCCALCYDAGGLHTEDPGLSPRDRYLKHADGRHGGLLDIAEDSPAAFLKWLVSSEWHGAHPWEIRRGGNSTHISLCALADGEGLRLILEGSATSRAAETLKMALALHREGIQFILHDVDLHLRRTLGEDWLGFYPSRYGWKGRFYFPADADITDFYSWREYSESSGVRDAVVPLPLS